MREGRDKEEMKVTRVPAVPSFIDRDARLCQGEARELIRVSSWKNGSDVKDNTRVAASRVTPHVLGS